MADPKVPTAAPKAPKAPAPAPTPTPTQTQKPAVAPVEKAPKAPKPKLQAIFDSSESAIKEAADREKGPRRAFECKFGDQTIHVVANNEGRAGGEAFLKLGGTVTELGKKARVKGGAPVGIDAIMAAINSLPEAERAAVMAQMKGVIPE